MTVPEFFSCHTAVYAPVGEASLDHGIAMIEKAIAHASAEGYRALLVDITQLRGYAVPSVVERFQMIRRWSKPAGSMLRMAVVCDAKYIHEDRVGVILGRSQGFIMQPFTNRSEAMAWLALECT
jgi:hypothetical protein